MENKRIIFVLVLGLALQLQALAQIRTGVSTKDPKATLDVNGTVKINSLQNADWDNPELTILVPDVNATGDAVGLLHRSTPLDVAFSSGLYVAKESLGANWKNIYVGAKTTRLDFTGWQASSSSATTALSYITFSVLYSNGFGFTNLPAFSKAVNDNSTLGTIAITSSTATTFKATVNGTEFVFTISPSGTSGVVNMDISGSGGQTLSGTFFSTPMYN